MENAEWGFSRRAHVAGSTTATLHRPPRHYRDHPGQSQHVICHTACVRATCSACATSAAHGEAQQSGCERRLGMLQHGSTVDARIARGNGKRLTNDRSDAEERATLDGMHQGVCLGRTFLWFLTKEVFAREWCRERGKSAMRSSTEKK